MPGAQMASSSLSPTHSANSQHSLENDSRDDISTSGLILVPDREDDDSESYSFTDEEDLHEQSSTPEVILSPFAVFVFFLSPYLKLGSMLVLSSQAPLKFSLPALLVFSFLSAYSRQIWFLLARYVRKSDVGDIVAEAIGRGQRKEGHRSIARLVVRFGSGLVRMLLAVVYLKGAISCIEPLWPNIVFSVSSSVSLSVVFVGFVSSLSIAPTLASRRLVYSTGISNVLYIAWLCAIIYAHAKGLLNTDNVMLAQGRLLQDIPSIAFAFSSLTNLDVYSAMGGSNGNSDRKERRYLSVSSISFTAALVGTGLVLPAVFPSVKSHGDKEPTEDSSVFQAMFATITAFILLLAIPPLITTSPSIPMPSVVLRVTRRPLGKYVLSILLFILSLLPQVLEPALEDLVVVLVLLSTYSLPALLHIILHNIRRPISIIVDPRPLLQSPSSDGEISSSGYDRDTEELLLRKERVLQRRRLGRRVMWDIGVWILLVPVGGGGMIWAVGRLANAW